VRLLVNLQRKEIMSQLIYTLIPKIMQEIGYISKDRRNNQGQGYDFRGIDDCLNALSAPLAKNGVFFAPEVLSDQREERQSKSGGNLIYTILRVKFRFYAGDGSHIEVTTVGEAMDSGDKSANKAMSAALKYALFHVFCIPTEDGSDTENESHEVEAKAQSTSPRKQMGVKQNNTPIVTGAASQDQSAKGIPECHGKKMMISKYNEDELYCLTCKTKRPRE
jgi:hypothetical protein